MRALLLAVFLATPAAADEAFHWVTQPKFQDAGAAHQGVVPLRQGDLWGLMGRDGQWLATPQYQAISDPGEGWLPVKKAGKWGAVDLAGAEVVGFDYDAIGKPALYTPFKYQGLWYALAPSGDFESAPLPFDTLLANDSACITGTQNNNFVTYSGGAEPFIQTLPEVQDALPPSEGMVAVKLPGDWVQLNCADGSMVIGDDAPFAAMRAVSDGYAAVQGDQGWGYATPYGVGIEFGGDYLSAGDADPGQKSDRGGLCLWSYCRVGCADRGRGVPSASVQGAGAGYGAIP